MRGRCPSGKVLVLKLACINLHQLKIDQQKELNYTTRYRQQRTTERKKTQEVEQNIEKAKRRGLRAEKSTRTQ